MRSLVIPIQTCMSSFDCKQQVWQIMQIFAVINQNRKKEEAWVKCTPFVHDS